MVGTMSRPAAEAQLRAGLEALSLQPTQKSIEQLLTYANLLLRQNRHMNLTALRETEKVISGHFLDSALLLGRANFAGQTVLDVGTGAGFPGLVLKILCPSLQLSLLDSQQKRMDWLREELVPALQLEGVRFLVGRGEELGQQAALRETFSLVVSRAVAELPILAELCLPFTAPGGCFLAMKGARAGEELQRAQSALQTLGGDCGTLWQGSLPLTGEGRSVIRVQKCRPTPVLYPRRWKKLQNAPL